MSQDGRYVSQPTQPNSSPRRGQWTNLPPPSPTISRSQSTWRRSLSQLTLRKSLPAMVVCRVVLLDQENYQAELPKNANGQVLFDNVKQRLSLEEADYFGLSYRNSQNLRFWLILDKRIDKQLETNKDMVFYWEVKFYPPAPELLNEDLTRYLVVLQIRQDLFTGRLPASFQTQAILGSFTAQGEIGDFDNRLHTDIGYLRPYSFAPQQSEELLLRIWDLHKTLKGLTPAEADLYFLETAKKCALYGMDMYTVRDSANKEVKVGVSACGLYIYHGRLRMECFKWPRIVKMEYKRKVFRVKVRPAEFERNQQTLGYQLPSIKMAKRLMRIAVENHQFFRLKQPELTDTGTLRGFGSRRWRMSGRTQAQLRNMNESAGSGPVYKSFSRTNSVMSSDNSYPLHQSTGTMPVPASRRLLREPDVNKNYNTIGQDENTRTLAPSGGSEDEALPMAEEGRVNGADKMADASYEVEGEYVLGQPQTDSSKRRDSNPQSRQRLPTDGSNNMYSPDNLVNGERDTGRNTDVLPDHSSSFDKTPGSIHRQPGPLQKSTDDLEHRQPLVDNMVARAAPAQLASMDLEATSGELQNGARYKPSPLARHLDSNHPPDGAASPSTGHHSPAAKSPDTLSKSSDANLNSPTAASKSPNTLSKPPRAGLHSPISASKTPSSACKSPSPRSLLDLSSAPIMSKFGLGQLPLPSFSLESAGVMPTGGIDHSVKLETAERAEKVIKVGVPPTVKTTCMKFSDGSLEPSTRSTWSPPTVKTEKRHFNYMPTSSRGLNGFSPAGHDRITQTTTYTTERDGYVETKVKHTITLSGEADIDDKLLLDAIQAVTGFDNTLGVDKIEIKTETAGP